MAGGSINLSSEFSDVTNESYVSGPVSVTSTPIEAKVGADRLSGRETITITNKGPNVLYYGPAGVTPASGDVLFKDQFVSLPYGDNIAVYVVTAGAHTATIIVQESA